MEMVEPPQDSATIIAINSLLTAIVGRSFCRGEWKPVIKITAA